MKRRLLVILLVVVTFTFVGCKSDELETVDFSTLPYESYLNDTNPVVTIEIKDFGSMQLQLFPELAGNTVNNFIRYIQDKDYNKAIFHRIIKDFMIQGGIVSDTNCAIEGEFASNGVYNNLKHYRGVISMARTNVKDSATSQFFIMHKTTYQLDGNYAGFGGMIAGFDVLDALAIVSTDANDKPLVDIVIKSIRVDLKGYVVGDIDCAS